MIRKLNSYLYFLHFRRFTCTSTPGFHDSVKTLKYSSDIFNSEDDNVISDNIKGGLRNKKYVEDITRYFNSRTHLRKLKSKIPSHYLTRLFNSHHCLYIINKEVAFHIFEKIKPYLQSQKGYILEVNAGLGVLTNYLLNANLPRLRIYEGDVTLYKGLQIKLLLCKSDVRLIRENLLELPKLTFKDKNDNENRVSRIFEDISPLAWEDDPVMTFIASISNEKFISHVIYCIIFQKGLCVYGRPDLFLIMPPTIYLKYMSAPNAGRNIYRHKCVIFQLLFECNILSKTSDKAFVPWLKKKDRKHKSVYQPTKSDENSMFLVRVTARRDLLQQVPPHLLKSLFYFIKKLLQKRSTSLIAVMETIIPGCGIRLIADGRTIYTTCGSLTPQEYLSLFKTFISWPEFNESLFTSEANEYFSQITFPGLIDEIMIESLKRKQKNEKSSNPKNEVEDEDSFDIDEENCYEYLVEDEDITDKK